MELEILSTPSLDSASLGTMISSRLSEKHVDE